MRKRLKFNLPLGSPKMTSAQRVLAQWRGVNLVPLQRAQECRARSAGVLLPSVLTALRIERRRAEAEVLKVWNQLLDPDVVAHAQPTGLHKGTLFVSVDSSAWLCEILRYRRKEILDRLQHSFGKDLVTRLSFRTG